MNIPSDELYAILKERGYKIFGTTIATSDGLYDFFDVNGEPDTNLIFNPIFFDRGGNKYLEGLVGMIKLFEENGIKYRGLSDWNARENMKKYVLQRQEECQKETERILEKMFR